ncbi:UNVERIFIED_CONTAM: hypothetical protein GTU68_050333 [Idotea baltica]|nr:hypothetical protein [Idotea baltica]
MQLRSSLLQQRYNISIDQLSQRSYSASHRSASRLTMEGESTSSTPTAFKSNSTSTGSFGSASKPLPRGQMTPSYKAEASKAIVGGTTIAENYEFSGVYHIFDQHKDSTTMVKFGHNDASLLGCSSLDGNITICHLDKDNPRVTHKLQKHTAGVTAFDWSSSNDLIVSAGMDGLICLWNASTGQCLRSVLDQANTQLLSCIFHPLNSNWIIAGNRVGLLQVMNISTGRYPTGGTSQVADSITSLTFDISGVILWAGNAKGTINSFKFDLSSGRLRKGKRTVVSDGAAVTCLNAKTWANREARDPSLLVSCACNGLFLYRITDDDGGLKLKKRIWVPHLSQPVQSTFSPIMSFRQGTCVVSGSEDCQVWILDIGRDSNPSINKLQGHPAPVLSVSFNYNESLLASSDASGLVIIWK